VGRADLGDLLAIRELMREWLDPRLANPLQLCSPVGEHVSSAALLGSRSLAKIRL